MVINRDDIIRIAREANGEPAWDGGVDWYWDELERFTALVIQHKALDQLSAAGQYEQGFEDGAAAEREECAKVCEAIDKEYDGEEVLATWCSDAIRRRSNHE